MTKLVKVPTSPPIAMQMNLQGMSPPRGNAVAMAFHPRFHHSHLAPIAPRSTATAVAPGATHYSCPEARRSPCRPSPSKSGRAGLPLRLIPSADAYPHRANAASVKDALETHGS